MNNTAPDLPASPEKTPHLLLENQLCFPLYAAARKVVNRYTPYLKPLGITYTQYIVLLALWEADGATVGDLCRRLYLDNGTVTPLLKKMEEAGLVVRSRSRQDERVVTVHLTEAGRALRQRAGEVPGLVGGCIQLQPEEASALWSLLQKLLRAVE